MALNLVKLAVGIESVGHLQRVQRDRLKAGGVLRHFTRNAPKRAAEVLDGGSLYWVVKGHIRVRQLITGFEPVERADGRRRCAIHLDPELVAVRLTPHRAIQGWRYLEAKDAPPDATDAAAGTGDLPPEMAAELRRLGLL